MQNEDVLRRFSTTVNDLPIAICNLHFQFAIFPAAKELPNHVRHPLGQLLLPLLRPGDVRLRRGRGRVEQHRADGRLPGRRRCAAWRGCSSSAGAQFLGAMQLMLYVGGTVVLLVFGVMLTARGPFVSMGAAAGNGSWPCWRADRCWPCCCRPCRQVEPIGEAIAGRHPGRRNASHDNPVGRRPGRRPDRPGRSSSRKAVKP